MFEIYIAQIKSIEKKVLNLKFALLNLTAQGFVTQVTTIVVVVYIS